jgi:CRISPR system Cascade subunit CasE
MYLSRVEINRQRFETKRALANPQIMHAAIMSCFPVSNGRVLWRTDSIEPAMYVLMTSAVKPDFTSFIQQFGWPASEQRGETKEYEPFLSRVENGSKWHFRLTANPIYRKHLDGEMPAEQRGKIFSHVTVEQQKKWLADRAASRGFCVTTSVSERSDGGASEMQTFEVVYRQLRRFKRQGKIVTIGVATFEGTLVVTDAELFVQTLRNCLGRAKAYGCGLLTIVKYHE